MTPAEWDEWKLYYSVEPFGSPVDDHRWATLCSLLYLINAKEGAEVPHFFDRDPERTQLLRRREAGGDAALEAFFEGMAARSDPER